MFPCCDLCYEKYIDKNGIVDQDRRKKAVNKYISFMAKTYKKTIIASEVAACNCECHRDGFQVLH